MKKKLEKFGKEEATTKKKVSKPSEKLQVDYHTNNPNVHITFIYDMKDLKEEFGDPNMSDNAVLNKVEKMKQKELDELVEKQVHKSRATVEMINNA